MKTKRVKNGAVKIKGKRYPVMDCAEWVAQDEGGDWFCYSVRPYLRDFSWCYPVAPSAKYDHILAASPRKNWRKSLRRLKR